MIILGKYERSVYGLAKTLEVKHRIGLYIKSIAIGHHEYQFMPPITYTQSSQRFNIEQQERHLRTL